MYKWVFWGFFLQERGTATEPPPRATFASNVTQWEIADAYHEDFEKQVGLAWITFNYYFLHVCFSKKMILYFLIGTVFYYKVLHFDL